MQRHRVSGRWRLGVAMAAVTVLMWGVLAIALSILIRELDAWTVTWFRFLTAIIILGGWLFMRGGLPDPRRMARADWVALALAIVGLAGNYVFFLYGVALIGPSAAQVVIQLAHLFVIAGAMVWFGERFTPRQWVGAVTIWLGLALFFHNRINILLHNLDNYTAGVLYMVAGAFLWAVYALSQKYLLALYSSQRVLWMVYVGSVLALWPAATPSALLHLSPLIWGLLAFSCVNTLIAYGCYCEACEHLEASRVSAILALIPMVTLISQWCAAHLWPSWVEAEPLTVLTIVGACLVVTGSMLTALGKTEEVLVE